MTKRLVRPALGLAAVLVLAACASAPGLKQLDPKSRDFISKVRYTITPEERKAFLALPPEAREGFIEDFWKRRDPTPNTPENEYRIEYYNRIERANRLFSGGGAPGWMQDRGRVYITLGPPDTRVAYPRGVTFYGLPTEVWWYGMYSIVFVDEYWNDDYKLSPESAAQIAVINQAQREWNLPREPLARPDETRAAGRIAGLALDLEVAKDGATRFTLSIPYRNVWMKASGSKYTAALEVRMKVVDKGGAEAWTFSRTFPIEVTEGRLRDVLATDFTAEASARLAAGSYKLSVFVTNTTDGSTASLERKFEI